MIYLTQSIHRNAQIYPNQLVTVYKHRERTWSQFKERIGRAAAGLVDLGVQSDDRVAILALNSDYYLEYYSLVPWAGACVVPLNIRWSVKENAYSANAKCAIRCVSSEKGYTCCVVTPTKGCT